MFDNLNVDAIYLTDTKKNITTNLLTDDYSFSIGSAETNDNRFYVSIVRKAPGITTGLSNNSNLSCYAVAINGMLSIYNVPMGAYVSLYDLIGRKINSEISFSNKLDYRLPSNTYIVCIESGAESARLKVIVK